MWPFWLLAGLVWLALWVWVFARFAADQEGDALVALFHSLLPVFCVTTCLAAFVAVPERLAVFHKLILWAHHASVLLLFLFLFAAEYWQAEAWWRRRRGGTAAMVAGSYRRLWVLTETMPAPIALTVLLTGLRLIWDAPETNSPASFWLLGMVVGFSVFFWDGIFGYQPIVRQMWAVWRHAASAGIPVDAVSTARRGMDSWQLLLHFLSWPLIFLLGLFRWNPAMALTQTVSQITDRLRVLPRGWPETITASLVWVVAGMAVLLVRLALRPARALAR